MAESFIGFTLGVDKAQIERFKGIVMRILEKHPDLESDIEELVACVKMQPSKTE